jgi:AcrR family transcriptional regulator
VQPVTAASTHERTESITRGRSGRRQEIVEAALHCFSRRGYNKTTMDDIVAESELSKGTLYWYFDGKEELFEAALLSVFEGFGESVLAMLETCDTATDKLQALGREAAAFSDTVGGYFSLFLEFWVSRPQPDDTERVWYDLLEEYKTILTSIVDEGIRNGEFRPVDAESLVWALMATYDGLAAYAEFVTDLDVAGVSETFIDTLLEGLTVPQRADS